jgi:predicted PurR-regulated permease PerM
VNEKEIILPFYLKATIALIGLIAFFTIMYIGQDIIVPVVFAVIIAILLHPVVNFFIRLKINRVIAIIITLFLTFIVLAAFVDLLFSQAHMLYESWPKLVDKFTIILNQSIASISGYLDVDPQNIHEWIVKTKGEIINSSSAVIGQTIIMFGSGVILLLLIPTYTFIILYYQPLLREFIRKLFASSDQSQVKEIATQVKTLIQRYLIGLVIEFVLMSILNSTALLLLGIQYAILLGTIGAMLNVIPYIGGIVAVALPMMVAVATKTTAWYAVYVMIAYYVIQLFDNNIIVPVIVASKVKINALFSIIVVFIGNALWGIPGMFLSIPLLAIVKLFCDNIEPLKPWGFLLGYTMPPLINLKPPVVKVKK